MKTVQCCDTVRTVGKLRVLVVDNDQEQAESLTDLLKPRGYRLAVAHSVEEAHQRLADFDVQVALIDIHLGRECSVNLVRELAQSHPDVLCVMITTNTDWDSTIELLRAGAFDFLSKPFTPTSLFIPLDRCEERIRLERDKKETQWESEKSWRELAEVMPQPVWTCTPDGDCDYLSHHWGEYTGKTEAEQLGYNWLDQVHPDDRDLLLTRWHQALETGVQLEVESRFRRADGEWRWFLARAVPVRDTEGRIVKWYGSLSEIDDLKQAQSELQEKERYYRGLMLSLHEDILVIDRDYRITDINNTALQTLGLKREEVIGQHCYEVSHGLDTPCHERGEQCGLCRVFESGKPCSLHHEHVAANGDSVHVDLLMSPMKDEDGNITHVIEAVRDVTELRKTQESLVESQATLQAAMDHCQAGIAIADAPDGKLRYVNEAGLLIRGGSREEIVNGIGIEQYVSRWQILHLDGTPFRDDEVPLTRAICYGETCSEELIIRRMDEEDRIVWATAAPIRNVQDEVVAGIVAFLDVTERKQAERAIYESEAKFRELVESSSDWIWEVNAEGVYTYASPQVEAMLGYKPEEVVGKTPFDLMPPEEVEQIAGIFKDATSQGAPLVALENVNLHKDGRRIVLETSGVPVLDQAGAITGYRGVDRDITERKLVEQRLQAERVFSDTIIQSMPGLFYIFEETSARFVRRNGNWSTVTGYSEDELDAMTALDTVADRDLCANSMQEVYARGYASMEDLLLTKSGERIPYHFTGTKLTADGKTFLVGMGLDISDRKRAEEAMEKRLVALTRPLEGVGNIAFEDLFDLDDIQRLQDQFAKATGVASIITNTDGTPITKPSNFCRLCRDIIRKSEKGCANCIKSDATLGCFNPQGPSIQPCMSGGLWDAGAAISISGRHIANWLIGQVRDETQTEEKMLAYAREIDVDEDAVIEAFREVPAMSLNQFEQIAQALFTLANQLSDMAYQNIQQARFIADRKQAEEKLRHLRNYLSNIIDSMPSILVGVDFDGNVTQWNSKAERAAGVSVAAAVGKPLGVVFPRLAAEIPRVSDAMRSGEVCSDPRQACMEGDETRYEDVTIYPLVANGIEGAVIRVDDVTEQVRMEEIVVQSEKMLSVGGLAAGMAHEINNPLAGMMQAAAVISGRLTNLELPANRDAAEEAGTTMEAINAFMESRDIIELLQPIRESGERAAEIVANMLSFARKGDSVCSSHDLAQLLDQCVELAGSDYDLKKKYDFRQIEIVREFEDGLPLAVCESGKIQQVLLNLLRNGAEAMQEAVEENGDMQPRFILRLAHEREAGMIRIEIEDNGPGMDEATRRRVFEPFFTTKPTGQGTGLGLSVSYFIITENHGGEMSVESQPGSGSKFSIRLPVPGASAT